MLLDAIRSGCKVGFGSSLNVMRVVVVDLLQSSFHLSHVLGQGFKGSSLLILECSLEAGSCLLDLL